MEATLLLKRDGEVSVDAHCEALLPALVYVKSQCRRKRCAAVAGNLDVRRWAFHSVLSGFVYEFSAPISGIWL